MRGGMMAEMKYVCLYSEYLETLKELSDEEMGRLVRGMLAYNNHGAEPAFQGNERFLWGTVKAKIDRDNAAYSKKCGNLRANGKKGGRPRNSEMQMGASETKRFSENQEKANQGQTKTKTKTETKDILNALRSSALPKNPIHSDVVAYLNRVCGTNYRASSQATKRLIDARTNEGYSLDDFKTVIDNKQSEWGKDSKMRQYLRPETLFGTKFESYLNQRPKQQPKPAADDDLAGIL